jgi:hypothetical protein
MISRPGTNSAGSAAVPVGDTHSRLLRTICGWMFCCDLMKSAVVAASPIKLATSIFLLKGFLGSFFPGGELEIMFMRAADAAATKANKKSKLKNMRGCHLSSIIPSEQVRLAVLSCLPVSSPSKRMSIGFRVKTDQELRDEFAKLNDAQLIETGRMLKDFAKPRPGQGPDRDWLRQLEIAREVWRERHPRSEDVR